MSFLALKGFAPRLQTKAGGVGSSAYPLLVPTLPQAGHGPRESTASTADCGALQMEH